MQQKSPNLPLCDHIYVPVQISFNLLCCHGIFTRTLLYKLCIVTRVGSHLTTAKQIRSELSNFVLHPCLSTRLTLKISFYHFQKRNLERHVLNDQRTGYTVVFSENLTITDLVICHHKDLSPYVYQVHRHIKMQWSIRLHYCFCIIIYYADNNSTANAKVILLKIRGA